MTGPDDIATLRIELRRIEPLIWRRVKPRRGRVPGSFTEATSFISNRDTIKWR